ncbi:10332_t:CDS:2, partial [Cetraspora pellucida]
LSGHSNYQLPPEVGQFLEKKWSEILARTAQKDLQKEAQNYVIRKNWDLYLSLRDKAGHLSISAFLLFNNYNLVADKVSTEKITLGVAMDNVNIDILES